MVFSSVTFLFVFLPVVLFVYYLLDNRLKNLFLTIASLFFYAWGEKKMVMLMIFSIGINYLGGIIIEKSVLKNNNKLTKLYLTIFISINILTLGYFKYSNFFIDTINDLNFFKSLDFEKVLLPIGISFFIFQGMSYLIDIYYKNVNAQKKLISLALYISMFPQLIAGPIVRYVNVSKQIDSKREFNAKKFTEGIIRFIKGLFKKIIIANQLGFVADIVFNNSLEVGSFALWIGVICYSFQIYFDFSGYSDMAIGLGKMFGFDFLENFNYPYISKSIQEFWRRWHISLSSWFRDYLYIPLGGNRKGHFRTYFNLFLVFLITGLWHGSSWSFVFWGLFHGLFIILERLWLSSVLKKAPNLLSHLYTLLVVIFGWIFFRADTLHDGMIYIRRMFLFINDGNEILYQHLNSYLIFVLIMAFAISINIKNLLDKNFLFFRRLLKMTIFSYISYICLFIFTVLELAETNYNPFIYFRF